jgi:hypothetical protein
MKTLRDQLGEESVYDCIRFIQDQMMKEHLPYMEGVVRVADQIGWENHKEFVNLMQAVEQLEEAMGAMADKCHTAIEKMESNGFEYGKLG